MRGQVSRDRVLRGGSWNNNQNNARCADRNRNNPNNSNNNVGFRLVSHAFRLPGRQCHGSNEDAGRGHKERRRDLSLADTRHVGCRANTEAPCRLW